MIDRVPSQSELEALKHSPNPEPKGNDLDRMKITPEALKALQRDQIAMGHVAVTSTETSTDAQREQEQLRYAWLYRLAAPTAPEEEIAPRDDTYDHLFSDEELDGPEPSVYEAAVGNSGKLDRTKVTEESVVYAQHRLQLARLHDEDLGALIYTAAGGLPVEDQVQVLRTDHELRVKILDHLIKKIDANSMHMPQRVRDDSDKAPNATGESVHNKLRSRVYVARLALDTLSGNFHPGIADKVTYSPDTDKGVGQHRYARDMIL